MKKVSIKQDNKIIFLPKEQENIAHLTSIKNGYYFYDVQYVIDPILIAQRNGFYVSIKVLEKLPETNPTPLNANNLVSSLLRATPVKKENIIFEIKSDFTKVISNNDTQKINNASTGDSLFFSKNIYNVSTVGNLLDRNISIPLHEITPTLNQQNIQSDTKNISLSMLLNNGEDPSNFDNRRSFSPINAITNGIYTNIIPSTITNRSRLVTSLMPTQTPTLKLSQLNANSIVSYQTKTIEKTLLVKETLQIPVGAISNDFYLVFDLIDVNGSSLQKLNYFVFHTKNLNLISIPKIVPIVNGYKNANLGTNVIEIKQIDPSAMGFKLYRKEISESSGLYSSRYSLLGSYFLTNKEKSKKIKDQVSNGKTVIYRVIPFGFNDSLSPNFSSTVIKAVDKNKFDLIFVSLNYELKSNSIRINALNIPSSVFAVSFYRQDMNLSQRKRNLIDKPILLNGINDISIEDVSVKRNKIYEYTLKLLYKDGRERWCSNSILVNFKPETSNIVDTTISNTKVLQNGSIIDCQFDLKSSLVLTNESQIKSTLEKEGILQFFTSGISVKNLKDIIGYQITRNNLTTGEIEDFGTTTETTFSDVKFGAIQGAKPIEDGFDYNYVVSTFLRSPETSVENFDRSVVDNNFSAKNYTFKPFKWLHPFTLNEGTIGTSETLKMYHAENQFTFGRLGKITTTSISLAKTLPNIVNANAVLVSKTLINIQWSVQGTLSKIEHFILSMDILGKRTIIGKTHNISDSNQFNFLYTIDKHDKGAASFYIIPIYYDYTSGKEIGTNKIVLV